jgi:chemotaxis protein methyltransferase CheR
MASSAQPELVAGALSVPMSDREFSVLADLIWEESGIRLTPQKQTMLACRLAARLRATGLETFAEYYDLVASPEGRLTELPEMIDAVSTNKTEFFREPSHFTFLATKAVPFLLGRPGRQSGEPFRVWSAACSTGEEPYTAAMVLADKLGLPQTLGATRRYAIVATDINREVLARARAAVYPLAEIEPVPTEFRARYLMYGKGARKGLCRVVPELRAMVTFAWYNLLSNEECVQDMQDVIFCRNVLIYFDRPTQERVVRALASRLRPGGYLFIGHSESLTGISGDLRWVAPTIYQVPTEAKGGG